MNPVRRAWRRVTEQIVTAWGPFSFSGLRSLFRVFGSNFFGDGPRYENTIVSYDVARQLYRNDGSDSNLGGQFARPIVDLQVDFIGLPTATVEDESLDDFLNACLQEYWAEKLTEMKRNTIRDSKCIVRLIRDDLSDPLATVQDNLYCRLVILNPENVMLEYQPGNETHLVKAVIHHRVILIEEEGDPTSGVLPKEREHDIYETITEDEYVYYDKTDNVVLDEFSGPNTWGFVPLVEVMNEFDSSLNGGQSDLEAVYPFIRAFHDVLTQALTAHKYHSIPKAIFSINEVQSFIKNNYPEVLNEDGSIKPQSTINWQGREMFFLKPEEDGKFLEARSVLGDSKTMLEFLIDCICVASETPRWAFMVVDAGSANQADNAQVLPWTKKILRKRNYFNPPIQRLLKMVLKANNFTVSCPKLSWEITRIEDQAAFNQAFQMLVMGLEVAAQRKLISDETYRETIRAFLPKMKNPTEEKSDAQSNFEPLDVVPNAGSNGSGNAKNIPVTSGQQGKNE
jgi:hypothetical protein